MRAAAALAALSLAVSADAFYFFVRPGVFDCFTEELSLTQGILHIDYKAGKSIEEGHVFIEVVTPRSQTIHTSKLTQQEGALQVKTGGVEGPHSVCLVKREGKTPVMFSLSVEHHEISTGDWVEHTDPASGRKFYHNPKSKESVWELPAEMTQGLTVANVKAAQESDEHLAASQAEMELYANYMKALQALMDQIRDESTGIIERQFIFKETAVETASAVWWLSLAQLLLCAVIPLIQTYQLKRLFIAKKLV